VERYGLARIAHYRDANKVAIADNSAAGVEINPAGSGQIDLSPGMGVAAATVVAGDVQIPGDEARCHPEGTGGIDHQHGKVATAPASECQSLERGLNALLVPSCVPEGPSNAMGEVDQKLARIGRPIPVQKCSSPSLDLAIRVERSPLHPYFDVSRGRRQ
jgi:hypothetical protein